MLAAGLFHVVWSRGLAGRRLVSVAWARALCRTARLRVMVVAAARVPSWRRASASSADRSTWGSFRLVTGRDARRSQVSVRAMAGSEGSGWAGLKACW